MNDNIKKMVMKQTKICLNVMVAKEANDIMQMLNSVVMIKRPTIVFATMCKNEEHCILQTLESVADHIDYWIVCDTGSTDKTIEIVKSFFKERNIPGELHQDEWVGFDHNKTLMMERSKGKADYIMHLDADDLLVGDFSFQFAQVFNDAPIDFEDAYFIPVKRGTLEWKALIMFNGNHSWKFCGVAHTTIKNLDKPNYTTGDLSSGEFYISGEGIGSRAFDPKKYLYDAERLQKQFWDTLVNDPDELNTRSVFYTAQSYMDYGMYREALQWNRLYLKLKNVWVEEVFEAYMRSSICLIQLQSNLNEIIVEMESAINLFPDRAEPYLTLGRYLNSIGEWELAYGYLSKAHTLSLDDAKSKYLLFINEKAYGKYINDELCVSCYWTGRYQEGLDYLLEILNDLEFESSKDRLLHNLKNFNNKLNEKN